MTEPQLFDPGCRYCNWSPITEWSPVQGMCQECYEIEKQDSLNNSKDLENKVTTAEKEMSLKDIITENY